MTKKNTFLFICPLRHSGGVKDLSGYVRLESIFLDGSPRDFYRANFLEYKCLADGSKFSEKCVLCLYLPP